MHNILDMTICHIKSISEKSIFFWILAHESLGPDWWCGSPLIIKDSLGCSEGLGFLFLLKWSDDIEWCGYWMGWEIVPSLILIEISVDLSIGEVVVGVVVVKVLVSAVKDNGGEGNFGSTSLRLKWIMDLWFCKVGEMDRCLL